MNRVGFLITARLRSTRLPRKLMLPLDGTTVISKVIERALHVPQMESVVLCTSDLPGDDELEAVARAHGIACFRGSPEDVLVRLRDACHQFGYAGFVGITGENPLFHPEHCAQTRDLLLGGADLVRTTGLPVGCAVYGVSLAALDTICMFKEEADTEIWGYLLNRPEIFDVRSIEAEPHLVLPDVRLTIDYPEDLELMRALFALHPGMPELGEVIQDLRSRSDLRSINSMRVQSDLDQATKDRLNAFFTLRAPEIRSELERQRMRSRP